MFYLCRRSTTATRITHNSLCESHRRRTDDSHRVLGTQCRGLLCIIQSLRILVHLYVSGGSIRQSHMSRWTVERQLQSTVVARERLAKRIAPAVRYSCIVGCAKGRVAFTPARRLGCCRACALMFGASCFPTPRNYADSKFSSRSVRLT